MSAENKAQIPEELLLELSLTSPAGKLISGLVHDMNNPLGYVSNNLTSLKEYMEVYCALTDALITLLPQIKETDETRETLESVHSILEAEDMDYLKEDVQEIFKECNQGCSELGKFISSFSAFSTQSSGGELSCHWHSIIQNALYILHNRTKYSLKLSTELEPVADTCGNPQNLTMVLVHLLLNAAEASPDNGKITLKCEQKPDHISIEIHNEGTEFSMDMESAFQPLHSSKPGHRGLGLYMAKRILEHWEATLSYKITKTETIAMIHYPVNQMAKS